MPGAELQASYLRGIADVDELRASLSEQHLTISGRQVSSSAAVGQEFEVTVFEALDGDGLRRFEPVSTLRKVQPTRA